MKTKNKNYIKIINISFDEIDVLDVGFEFEKIEVKYTATFYDKHTSDWAGFYYDGCNVEPFKDKATSDFGNQKQFDSIQEIIDLIPDARNYHKSTTHVLIERFVSFVDSADEIILYMAVGRQAVEV